MDNLGTPPSEGSDFIKKALQNVVKIYKKCGLSDNDIDKAIHELEPILEQFTKPYKSEMTLPSNIGLSSKQIAGVVEAHTDCVQEIFTQHAQAIGMSLCVIAGLIGSKYSSS